jgi:gastric triacylglycerol lipase
LQHGLFDSSDSWVSNYENKSLPFILANKGYDVWLGNNRGNKHSRNHIKLNPDKNKEFWKFSLHEMGTLDLPAMIDFILKETGSEKISYIGHSQGTSQLFAALTLDNEYFSKRLNAFIALGPVTRLHEIGSSFVKITAQTRLDSLLVTVDMFNEFLPNIQALSEFQKFVCGKFGFFCTGILSLLADSDPKNDDIDRFQVFISHFPSGASLRSLHHFAEIIRNNNFAQIEGNPYALQNIKNIPISLFVGKNDLLASPEDNRVLKNILSKNGVLEFYKEYDNMGHCTFFISKENNHMNDLLSILDRLN